MPFDWNDLRCFLAVLEHGSTKRAATALRIDQTTCARRLGAMESALGLELFSRAGGRYAPTGAALELRPAAVAAGKALADFESAAARLFRENRRALKITCEEFWAPLVVLPALADLKKRDPAFGVELEITGAARDLARGEADIALRSSLAPSDDSLVWRKLGDDPIGIYCAAAYPDPPTTLEQLAAHPFVGHSSHVERLREAGAAWNFRDIVNSWGPCSASLSKEPR